MRRRRAILIFSASVAVLLFLGASLPEAIEQTFGASGTPIQEVPTGQDPKPEPVSGTKPQQSAEGSKNALSVLATLEVKGRAPKTGYERSEFGNGWATVGGCSMREVILHRDLQNVALEDECTIVAGTLNDPYTGTSILFSKENSSRVQIDHVVALSDAWQKGAQQLSREQRIQLANDPLELLAVDGPANQQKSDGDAATWLPKNRPFRCAYVARQIAVKVKYALWVTAAEKSTMEEILSSCPTEALPTE